jgi:hypothetical protein
MSIISDFFTNFRTFWIKLFDADKKNAESLQLKGCPLCKSRLYSSHYYRTGRGIPEELRKKIDEKLLLRHRFVCSNENCRKSFLPDSLRFFFKKKSIATPSL